MLPHPLSSWAPLCHARRSIKPSNYPSDHDSLDLLIRQFTADKTKELLKRRCSFTCYGEEVNTIEVPPSKYTPYEIQNYKVF